MIKTEKPGWLVVSSAGMSERGSDEAARGLELGKCSPSPISLPQSPRVLAAFSPTLLLGRTEKNANYAG